MYMANKKIYNSITYMYLQSDQMKNTKMQTRKFHL